MPLTSLLEGQSIRTDWIDKIQRGKEHGIINGAIWLSIGPVGVYTFTGKNAQTALQLLANHPALGA